MRWCCFLFWFVYRLALASLAHFNWLISIYANCAYFMLWKSYDLIWFWMHLILCICFKPLRTENYLIVWCNLFRKRIALYPDSTYKEIYIIEYGKQRRSKVERELDRIREAEASERERDEHDSDDNDRDVGMTHSDVEQTGKEEHVSSRDGSKINGAISLAAAVRGEEERECMEHVFLSRAAVPSAADIARHYAPNAGAGVPIPPPRFKKQTASQLRHQQQQNVEYDSVHVSIRERWKRFRVGDIVRKPFTGCKHCGYCAPCRTIRGAADDGMEMVNERTSNGDSDAGSQIRLTARIRRYVPFVRRRQNASSAEDVMDILCPDFTNKRDLTTSKEIARREKRDRKALTKRLRARRRAELAALAKYEAKQKTISNAIELLLQILRMMTSFAILIGNIRKTFIPAQFKWLKPGSHAYDNPELMMLWRCTVFLDVLLFWTNVIWAYCLQWHLCCRLGLLKFWMWVLLLVLIGGIFMLYPMSFVQQNLDISWCRFKPNSTLAQYQPDW